MNHYIHPFPARMAPEIALRELRSIAPGAIVVDPMVGSGTTMHAAQVCGHHPLGFDLDPLAVRIARAECAKVSPGKLLSHGMTVLEDLNRVDRRTLKRYPEYFDYETKEFCDRWFPRYNQPILTYLSQRIRSVRDSSVRNVLEIVLSGTIVVKQSGCSFARDVAHSRPHFCVDLVPRPAEELFLKRLRRIAAIYEKRSVSIPAPQIRLGDCRQLPIKTECADLVITSPPYVNALDYLRGHRLSLIWLGYTVMAIRQTRARSIGSEAAGRFAGGSLKRTEAIGARYASDLQAMIHEISRILKVAGCFVCVVGDNKRSKTSNANLLTDLCRREGLRVVAKRVRSIPGRRRYLPPPSAATGTPLDSRMVRETILTFSKVS